MATKHNVICQLHFTDDMFKTASAPASGAKRKLRKTAIPNKFSGPDPEQDPWFSEFTGGNKCLNRDAEPTLGLPGDLLKVDLNMEEMQDQCRLCNAAAESGVVVNIFKDVLSTGETYALQIQEMFQLELVDTPGWPKGCCSGCATFLDQMKTFKQSIIDRHCVLDEKYRKIAVNTDTKVFQEAAESLPKHPNENLFEAVFFEEHPGEPNLAHPLIIEDELDELIENQGEEEEESMEIDKDDQKSVVECPDVEEHKDKRVRKRIVNRCRWCEMPFKNTLDLTNHIRIEHLEKKTDRKITPLTDEELSFEKLMIDRELLKCHICAKKEDDFRTLSLHYKKAHQMREGIYCCGLFFPRRRAAFDHMRHHMDPDIFKCQKCDIQFISSSKLNFHNFVNHDGPSGFVCKTCGRSYPNRQTYRKHTLTAHLAEEDKRFKCHYCDKAFSNGGNMRRHVSRVHEKVYSHVCHICEKAFPDPEYLQNHIRDHEGRSRDEHAALTRKRSKLATTTPKGDKLEQCNICKRFYCNVNSHIANVHKLLVRPRFKWGRDKKFCDKCGRYISDANFTAHRSRCEMAKGGPTKCNLCNKTFAQTRHLNLHIHYVHNKKREIACPYCDFKSVSRGNRLKHILYSHPEEHEKYKMKPNDVDEEPGPQSNNDDVVVGNKQEVVIEQGVYSTDDVNPDLVNDVGDQEEVTVYEEDYSFAVL